MRHIIEGVEPLPEEDHTHFIRGVESVLYIRCMQHFKVPQYNENEAGGAECATCEVESERAKVEHVAKDAAETIVGVGVEADKRIRVAEDARFRAEAFEKAFEDTLALAISIIGGEVDGAPTSRDNFIQRLRELVQREKDYAAHTKDFINGFDGGDDE